MIFPRSFVFHRQGDPSHPNQLTSFELESTRRSRSDAVGRANSNLGNGILRPETFDLTRRQVRQETVVVGWQTNQSRRKPRKCRGQDRRPMDPGRTYDFLVADAVRRNRSPTGFVLSNRELLQNEPKNRGCQITLGYSSCKSFRDFNGIARGQAGFLFPQKTGVLWDINQACSRPLSGMIASRNRWLGSKFESRRSGGAC